MARRSVLADSWIGMKNETREKVERLLRYMEKNDLPPSYVMQEVVLATYEWIDIVEGRIEQDSLKLIQIEKSFSESVSAGHGPNDMLVLFRQWLEDNQ
jgi:hypothetical protein